MKGKARTVVGWGDKNLLCGPGSKLQLLYIRERNTKGVILYKWDGKKNTITKQEEKVDFVS